MASEWTGIMIPGELTGAGVAWPGFRSAGGGRGHWCQHYRGRQARRERPRRTRRGSALVTCGGYAGPWPSGRCRRACAAGGRVIS
jgi:hypothetical protein